MRAEQCWSQEGQFNLNPAGFLFASRSTYTRLPVFLFSPTGWLKVCFGGKREAWRKGERVMSLFAIPVGSVSGCAESVLGMGTWVAATKGRKGAAVELVRSVTY